MLPSLSESFVFVQLWKIHVLVLYSHEKFPSVLVTQGIKPSVHLEMLSLLFRNKQYCIIYADEIISVSTKLLNNQVWNTYLACQWSAPVFWTGQFPPVFYNLFRLFSPICLLGAWENNISHILWHMECCLSCSLSNRQGGKKTSFLLSPATVIDQGFLQSFLLPCHHHLLCTTGE